MDVITEDGETVQRGDLAVLGNTAVGLIARAEIDAQISTAKAYPRDIRKVVANITTLATLDEESAQESLYALVRSSKKKGAGEGEKNTVIEGPSIRLAEIAMQCFGNCRAEARVIEIDTVNKQVVAEGVFLDLESNSASKTTVRRSIGGKYGLFSQDMINVTSNAACAIAKRNAILSGIPRGLYRPAYMKAREIIAGTAETLTKNRDRAIKAFASFGVKPEQLFEKLEVADELDVTQEHIVRLRGMFATLKSGEETVETMFGKEAPAPLAKNPLVDDKPTESVDLATGEVTKVEPKIAPPEPQEQRATPEVAREASSDTGTTGGAGNDDQAPALRVSQNGEILQDVDGLLAAAMKRVPKGLAAIVRWHGALTPAELALVDPIFGELKRQAASYPAPKQEGSDPLAVAGEPTADASKTPPAAQTSAPSTDLNDPERIDWQSEGATAAAEGRSRMRAIPAEIKGKDAETEWLRGYDAEDARIKARDEAGA